MCCLYGFSFYICAVIDCKHLTLTEAENRNELWREGFFRVSYKLIKQPSGTLIMLDGTTKPYVEIDIYDDIVKGSHIKLDVRAEFVIQKLSSLTANRLFSYVRINIKYQSDVVYVSIAEAMRYCGVKDKTAIYDALRELAEHKVIKKAGMAGVYFINPYMVWRGAYPKKVIDEAKQRAALYNSNKTIQNTNNEKKSGE